MNQAQSSEVNHCALLLSRASSFMDASISDTFHSLHINELLDSARTSSFIAQTLNLNPEAAERFLNAAVTLGIVGKSSNGEFFKLDNPQSYSSESSTVLFWLINNHVADFIMDGKTRLDQINEVVGGNTKPMLDLAVEHGFVTFQNLLYSIPDQYKAFLSSTSLDYIGPSLVHYERVMRPMFSVTGLSGALATGKSQWQQIFGEKVSNPFDLYKDSPELLNVFMNGMHQLNVRDNAVLAQTINLVGVDTVLDIGGGSGPWSIELMRVKPAIKRIDIYELPDAISLLSAILNRYAPNQQSIHFLPGSFLVEPEQPYLAGISLENKYDLVCLGWILHDWNDQVALQILKKSYAHVKTGGRIMVQEIILPDSRVGLGTRLDIAMLLQTEGKERTAAEYTTLLEKAGFRNVSIYSSPTRRRIIEATK